MLVLITYDVNTQTAAGRTRLRKVAKECTNYGQRVQNSVFECQMDAAKCRQVKDILEKIIDKETDSLRFYYLGEKYKNKDSVVRMPSAQKKAGRFALEI